jgi:hypothetical protein
MQAILTQYLPATNFKGSRVKATCQAKSKTLHWDHALNIDENHMAAARALATDLGWNYGPWVGGGLPGDKGMSWVCLDARREWESFTLDCEAA